ncbi:MAG: type II toxin-antitoxin system VapC family toxin [Candidatus Melainabacteria bacterium]|nr:type II toxin-antitoxin system VapC family toxin [Candidatus Melainabacteria bacterium]
MPESPIVLDTHVWVWAVMGDKNLKPFARELIEQALRKQQVLVPSICIWETGMLWRQGRIQLTEPMHRWVREALDKSGFLLAPLTDAVAVEAALLPGDFHSDPADCMIIATARLEKAILLSRDSRMVAYGKSGHVRVMAV